jgi:DNA processing protein
VIDLSPAAVRRRTAGLAAVAADDDALAALDARMMWSALSEPGDRVAGALVAAHGPVRALEIALGAQGESGVAPAELAEGRRRWRPREGDVEGAAASARRAGVLPLTPSDPQWPRRLDDLGLHAPICLWVRGNAGVLRAPASAVAIVGSRAASAYGEHIAAELAAELAASGVVVVSGAAYGIDGMAHRGALAGGGPTIAWLAGGVDRPYPAAHRSLLDEIVATGGAVAGEVPCGSAPTKWRFLSRNRLIAASSDATLVVEAGWRSGSLNTAGHAAELGRPLGAVPGPVTSASSAGCHRLLREFDAQCVTSVDDVRELLGIGHAALPLDTPHHAVCTRARDALSTRSARSVHEIARRSGLSPDDAVTALGLLELEGCAERTASGWRSVAR